MTKLNYDAQGFIQGIKNLEGQTLLVHQDTTAILKILQDWQRQKHNERMNQRLVKSQAMMSQSQQQLLQEIKKQHQANNKHSHQSKPAQSQESVVPTKTAKQKSSAQSPRVNQTIVAKKSQKIQTGALADANTTVRQAGKVKQDGSPRDAKGRFTAKAEENAFVSKLGREIGKNVGTGVVGVAADNLDPLIDGAKELGRVVAPATRLASVAGGATIQVAKQYRIKRREPLPIEQDRHNRKLLDWLEVIAKNSESRGGLLGSLAGLLGRRRNGRLGMPAPMPDRRHPRDTSDPQEADKKTKLKKVLKVGGKALGAVGALLGIGMLASEWRDLDGQEKSAGVGGVVGGAGGALAGASAGAVAGAAIGSAVPVVGTAIGAGVGGVVGGIAGGVAGNTAGEYLGRKAYPQVKAFGEQMVGYGLPERLQSGFMGGMSPLFTTMPKLARMLMAGVRSMTASMGGMFTGGDTAPTMSAPTEKAMQASEYALMNAAQKSLSRCALYVNNAMREVGFEAIGHGKDVADNLAKLNPGKFETFKWTEDYVPQIGDVMSMPSHSGASHNYGHVAIYTKDGWVSDFKQGHKYGNSAAANAKYDAELRSGKIKGTVARQISDGTGTNLSPQGGSFSGAGAGGSWGGLAAGKNTKTSKANTQYDHLIMASAKKYGVEPALVKSLINAESGFNPRAHSSSNAKGLTQLLDGTAREMGVRNIWDPAQNIDGGTKYLGQLLKRYGGDTRKALAAYNAGMGNVDKAIKTAKAAGRPNDWTKYLPKPSETVPHGNKILQHLPDYRGTGSTVSVGTNTVLAAAQTQNTTTKTKSVDKLPTAKTQQPTSVGPVQSNTSYVEGQTKVIFGNKGGVSQNIADNRLAYTVTGGIGYIGGLLR